MRRVRSVFVLLLLVTAAVAQLPTAQEARAARAFEAAKKAGAPQLYAFLKLFPKGADLHMHLSGAVYAETFIAEAVKAGLCVTAPPPPCSFESKDKTDAKDKDAISTASCPVAVLDLKRPGTPLSFAQPGAGGVCARGQALVADAIQSQPVYDAMVDSFSMRAFVPSSGVSGHDQFFSTFDRFSGLKTFTGAWLDEVASRAAAQNEQYLEIMNTPTFSNASALGHKISWPKGSEAEVSPATLSTLREALLSGGLRNEVAIDSKEFADAKAARNSIEHCSPAEDSVGPKQLPGCGVKIHWLYQVLRGLPPDRLFAQTLLGFEVASANPDVVGINFVQPEDGRVSMQDYHLQMEMLDYLHTVYPNVHISLHAGELAPGMVAPDGLRFHIREAVELGHAERIGHGIDVLYEDRPGELLHEMAQKHVSVEINLTSNDGILGVKGSDHPLTAYRAAHVPFSLSTDDEGVSRSDLTHEYVRGALEQGLSYAELKQSARTSLEHSFLSGVSLYAAPDAFTRRKAVCAAAVSATSKPAAACSELLQSSERAAQQYELERRFAVFEAGLF